MSEGASVVGRVVGKGKPAAGGHRGSSEEPKVSLCHSSAQLQEQRWLHVTAQCFQP